MRSRWSRLFRRKTDFVSYDIICLIAEWPSAVEACREARGDNFYWETPEDPNGDIILPYAIERWYRGYDFVHAADYYWHLRPHCPAELQDRADPFLSSIYYELWQGSPDPPEDLAADVGVELGDYCTHYSMRPATVRTVLARARSFPWGDLERVAAKIPPRQPSTRRDVVDVEHFRTIVGLHEDWLAEAADLGRGVILLVSQ